MSGHSKWHNIKLKKGKADAQRGALFTKLSKELILAAKSGSSDPDANYRLKMAVEKARENNMPQDNIKRAIARASGGDDAREIEEIRYEGYGPGGIAVVVDAATDNRNRTASELRFLFSRHGGTLGETGSVAWMFEGRGIVEVEHGSLDEDAFTEAALVDGVVDVRYDEGSQEGRTIVSTEPGALAAVRDALTAKRLRVTSMVLGVEPKQTVAPAGEDLRAAVAFLDALEEHEDVQRVFSTRSSTSRSSKRSRDVRARRAMTGGAAAPAARPRRRPWIARQDWFFAVSLALFVGTSVWFGRAIQDFFAPSAKTVSTPTLIGETLGDAVSTSARMHLRTVVIQHTPSDRFPRDVIMRQDPPPGTQVREGRQISIVVSTGVQIFPMPDLRYESMREVGLDLSRFKLLLGKVKTVQSDEVPANHVVTQDPPPLSSVRVGSTVNVEVSKGGFTAIRAPSFVGMSVDEARDAAAESHVHLGQIVWTPFGRWGPPRGVVVRQSPPAGAVIDPLQAVSLQISAGPRESGYLIRQVHATATVPEDLNDTGDDRTPIVRVQVRDETGTWNVYNAYAQPKQRLDFNLTVVGTAELDVFVNNELLDSTSLGAEPKFQERQEIGPLPPGSRPGSALGETPAPLPAASSVLGPAPPKVPTP